GDPPAAMRYTESRLQALADDMMADLDKETVDFTPNYDETTDEPTVLPAPFPNLLVNGSAGIAVGMATNVPPHNLSEVIDGCVWLIENAYLSRAEDAEVRNESTTVDTVDSEASQGKSSVSSSSSVVIPSRAAKMKRLVEIIPGPDFPTGGYIVGRSGIVQAYTTGRGSILMRARSTIETNRKGDKTSIIVTEIPY